ncbi:hypothetical protein [Streptomyces lydicus]|uniref:hypothetical protein n=1 Tax=Streptomyces lydicus TaxID=47763 RepID=UPI0036F0FB5C
MSLKVESAARDMGAVLTANTAPLIVFTLAGGVVGDRFSRRLVLFVSHLGAAVTQSGRRLPAALRELRPPVLGPA